MVKNNIKIDNKTSDGSNLIINSSSNLYIYICVFMYILKAIL